MYINIILYSQAIVLSYTLNDEEIYRVRSLVPGHTIHGYNKVSHIGLSYIKRIKHWRSAKAFCSSSKCWFSSFVAGQRKVFKLQLPQFQVWVLRYKNHQHNLWKTASAMELYIALNYCSRVIFSLICLIEDDIIFAMGSAEMVFSRW